MGDKLLAVAIVYLTCHFIVNCVLSGFAGATEGSKKVLKLIVNLIKCIMLSFVRM